MVCLLHYQVDQLPCEEVGKPSIGFALIGKVGPTSIVKGCTSTSEGSLDHSLLLASSADPDGCTLPRGGRDRGALPRRDCCAGSGRGGDSGSGDCNVLGGGRLQTTRAWNQTWLQSTGSWK